MRMWMRTVYTKRYFMGTEGTREYAVAEISEDNPLLHVYASVCLTHDAAFSDA